GRGVKSESQGLFALSQPCPRCRGTGTVIEQPCAKCHGSARERRIKTYTVKIKPGVKDGTKIRLKGKGEAGENGGPAGDLVVVTHVAPSETYERRGDDLVVQVPVSFTMAALGGKVEVPTPEGTVSLKIPAGSDDGKLLRIKGRGAPGMKTAAGGVVGGGAVLAKAGALGGFGKVFLWLFAWNGVNSAWRLGGWIAIAVLAAGVTAYLVLRSRREQS